MIATIDMERVKGFVKEDIRMPNHKNILNIFRKFPLRAVGIALILLVAFLLLWVSNANSNEAVAGMYAQVYFDGEYRIGDGQWQEIIEGQHIPATKGDVTLRGNFHQLTPEGEYIGLYQEGIPIAFYLDHINVTIYNSENEPYVMDIENPLYGFSACGEVYYTGQNRIMLLYLREGAENE